MCARYRKLTQRHMRIVAGERKISPERARRWLSRAFSGLVDGEIATLDLWAMVSASPSWDVWGNEVPGVAEAAD